ncbi:uncharacterized protein STEHIDRAFT_169981 [Stereum hirsutum FP-91666 SS1]|uniref:uncharacterized protein n=1 Tax=Stereum hirsutum (strain FP-91666) TaxID=721885 RepID=UPI000444A226|nr:uncharacterized protein STEHIDRAFT_169981 [Stereum hirsutum FP-91666 SS1]EIM84219.1 hypothetical protein STEHIDRAFT_169981 [Stereum hirsutum FP-91666 SS1]
MPSLIPLDNLLGVAFIGVIISTAIYGITCLQVYHYYTKHCAQDSAFLKSFVAALLVLDSLHVALLATFYYHYTVTNFGDYAVLAEDTWSLLTQVAVGDILTLCVQMFFAFRIYQLSGNRMFIPIVIVLMATIQLALAIAYIVKGFHVLFFSNSAADIPYTTSALSIDIACDTIITITMIYYLQRNRSSFEKTNRAINLLITYALNTCLLTTLCTLACLISWVTSTNALVYALFYFILVRLYSCSFMSTLNSRQFVRAQLSGTRDAEEVIALSTFQAARGGPSHETSTGDQSHSVKETASSLSAVTFKDGTKHPQLT